MNKLRFTAGLLLAGYVLAVTAFTVYAQDDTNTTGTAPSHATILPDTEKSLNDCKFLMNEVSKNSCWVQVEKFGKNENSCNSTGLDPAIDEEVKADDVLACGIKTGSIHMWMVPYYIRYILEFIIGLSGLVSVGGLVVGGYLYLFAGVSQDKDKGKKAIQYAVTGMVLTLTAWALVNIVIALVTG